MKIKIEPNFTEKEFEKDFERIIQKIEKYIKKKLFTIGEMCVNYAKKNHTYQDQTGNLTSSIGYAVYHNGVQIMQSGFESGEGGETGIKALEALAKDITDKWVLIVIAGMHYAEYVEALGYDVISGSKLVCEREAEKMMNNLKEII